MYHRLKRWCGSDDTKTSTNNQDGSEDSGGSSTSAVLDWAVDVPVVDGARISVSRHSDSKVQTTVKGAQAQHIGKIVCVAGNETDREASTTHSGMLASSFKKNLMKTETEEIFRSSITAILEALLKSCRRIGTFSWNESSLRKVRERERYDSVWRGWFFLTRSKTFNSNNKIVKERIWITVNLTIQNCSEGRRWDECVCEPVQDFQDYTCKCPRSLNMSRRRRTSPSCVSKWFVGKTRRMRRNHKKRFMV